VDEGKGGGEKLRTKKKGDEEEGKENRIGDVSTIRV